MRSQFQPAAPDDSTWTIDNEVLPQAITLDLESPTQIGGVRILWEAAGVAHRYRIETSADQQAWKTAVDQTTNAIPVSQPTHRFAAAGVRYVRVTLTGYDDMGGVRERNMRPWPGIREIEVLP